MKLGFYYHVPFNEVAGKVKMPAFLGLFIDSLAEHVEELVVFMHSTPVVEGAEYELQAANIRFVNIGQASSAYKRFYFPSTFLSSFRKQFNDLDYMLVRGPSPLAPAFQNYIDPEKLVYLIVGSYKEGLKFLQGPWYRLWPIRLLNHHMHFEMQRMLRGKNVLVNSRQLFLESERLAKTTTLINTTTLKQEDFFWRDDTCKGRSLNLLFVGRIDIAKGLRECIEACLKLREANVDCRLTIVGWEEKGTSTTTYLRQIVSSFGLEQFITFAGRKKSGQELLSYYRTHDIYVLPSYHEGFPRTIWEAMANCIPVVTTTVGSIPDFLVSLHNAYLIPPKSVTELKVAIENLWNDKTLRMKLISNGFERVKDIRLDVQTKKIIDNILNA